MKITIKEIYGNKEVFQKLIQCAWDSPQKSLGVYRFYRSIEAHISFFERERGKLAKLLGEPVEDGRYKIKDENFDEYKNKLEEMYNMKVDADELPITLDDLSDIKYTDQKEGWLTPIEIYKLDEFLKKQQKGKEDAE